MLLISSMAFTAEIGVEDHRCLGLLDRYGGGGLEGEGHSQ